MQWILKELMVCAINLVTIGVLQLWSNLYALSICKPNNGYQTDHYRMTTKKACTMPYQHLGALQVVSHWLSHNLAGQVWQCLTTWKTALSQFFIFSDKKKGNGVGWGPGGQLPIFVECAWSKLCWLIGCTKVLIGHSMQVMYNNRWYNHLHGSWKAPLWGTILKRNLSCTWRFGKGAEGVVARGNSQMDKELGVG